MNLALYFLAIFCLSQSAGLMRWAAAPPDVIGFWRLSASALCFLPFVVRSGLLRDLWRTRRERLPVIVVSALFFFTHLWTFTFAAQNTRIAHCMILFATSPVWISLGNRLLFRESFGGRLIVSYVLAMAGMVLLFRHSLSFESGLVAGDMVALVSAVLFSGYILSGKKARQTTGNSGYSFVVYALAGVLFWISGSLRGLDFTGWPPHTWMAITGAVALPTLLGHALFSWLMKSMNINFMSCGKLLEPVFAALVAAVAFNEPVTTESQVSFALTAAGVLFLFVPLPGGRNSRNKRPA